MKVSSSIIKTVTRAKRQVRRIFRRGEFAPDVPLVLRNITVAEAVSSARDNLAENVPPVGEAPRIVYVARGDRATRWHFDEARGHYMQRDEYAENVPEALISACARLGWKLVVAYMGRAPTFDDEHPSYTQLAPGTVREIDYRDLGSALADLRMESFASNFGRWETVKADAGFQAAFAYKGVPLFDQFETVLDQSLPTLSGTHVEEYARWRAIFEHFDPLVVIGGRLDTRKGLVQAARACGVFAANVKLGVGEEMLAPFYVANASGEFDSTQANHLQLVWGERQVAYLSKRLPAHPSRLAAVGRTRNDSFKTKAGQSRGSELRRHLGIGPETEIVVYGANHRTYYARDLIDTDGLCCLSWKSYLEALTRLSNLAMAREDCVIVVKPHPADKVDEISEVVGKMPDHVVALTNADGFHNSVLLNESSLFISTVSSMFSEALASGCLPINLWLDEINYLYETARRDLFAEMAVTVKSLDAMCDCISHYLDHPDERTEKAEELADGLEAYFGKTDGHNAERAVRAALLAATEPHPEYYRQVSRLPDPDATRPHTKH